jgi:hypothetical protein
VNYTLLLAIAYFAGWPFASAVVAHFWYRNRWNWSNDGYYLFLIPLWPVVVVAGVLCLFPWWIVRNRYIRRRDG